MPLAPHSLIKRNPDIVSSEIDGETVMMDTSFEKYFGMKSVASHIWVLLEEETSLQALCEQLTREYAVSPEQCLDDVEAFILALLEQDMLRIREPAD